VTTPTPPANEIQQPRLRQLAAFLRESAQIGADWDAYSDQACDPDTFQPLDDFAYGLRQRRRDADTWRSFNRVRHFADDLLDVAEEQLAQLPEKSRTQWHWQITELRTALDELRALQAEWLDLRATAAAHARPGTQAYDEPLAERNAEAWHYLDTWALHGQAVLDIHTAAHHQPLPPPSAPIPPQAPHATAAKPTRAGR
jgi:hypothetical protein